MWNEYAREKLDELDRERARSIAGRPHVASSRPSSDGRLLRPIARAAGRRVRRLGEALEGWASAPRPHAG